MVRARGLNTGHGEALYACLLLPLMCTWHPDWMFSWQRVLQWDCTCCCRRTACQGDPALGPLGKQAVLTKVTATLDEASTHRGKQAAGSMARPSPGIPAAQWGASDANGAVNGGEGGSDHGARRASSTGSQGLPSLARLFIKPSPQPEQSEQVGGAQLGALAGQVACPACLNAAKAPASLLSIEAATRLLAALYLCLQPPPAIIGIITIEDVLEVRARDGSLICLR